MNGDGSDRKVKLPPGDNGTGWTSYLYLHRYLNGEKWDAVKGEWVKRGQKLRS